MIDLSQLPPPDVVEALDYESILAAMLADLQARDQAFTALLESDPAYKILQVAAYREVLLRQRVNDAARGVMLSFAVGSDLDQIGANFNVGRLLIRAADATAVPPTPAMYEADADFRVRIQLALEGITTAGSVGSYVFHALGASPDVKDVSATSPAPGVVEVYVLARSGSGAASPGVLSAVSAALNAEDVRPLTDSVSVQSAQIVPFSIDARIHVAPGPDRGVVQAAAVAALQRLLDSRRVIGGRISVSSIYAALQQPGVEYAELIAPTADIITDTTQAPYCTGLAVELESVV